MKTVVRSFLSIIAFSLTAILVISCSKNVDRTHESDSMYECKDGKCYPKKKPDLHLDK